MKQYNSMYLGMCITNNDPEKRGRVKVFVPHIMPSIYENWNKSGQDIEMSCPGDNLIDGLPTEIIKKLELVLPWAEAASPICGTSAPGNLVANFVEGAKDLVSKIFDQSPVAAPANISDLQGLYDEAIENWVGKDQRGLECGSSYGTINGPGNCLRGTQGLLGALTGHEKFNATKSGGLGENATGYSGSGGKDLTSTGLYDKPASLPNNYMNDPSQWKVGDVVAAGGGGPSNNGHIQVWTGKAWASDFTQNKILLKNKKGEYNNFVLHRPNEVGEKKINERASSLIGNNSSIKKETTSLSGEVAAACVHQSSNPINTEEGSTQYGSVANPNVNGSSASSENNTLAVGPNGRVDPTQLNAHLVQEIAKSKLNNYVPADGAKYGIDGTPQSWANYFTKLSEKESGYQAGQTFKESFSNSKGERVISTGLFQVSYESVRGYGVGKGLTDSQLNSSLKDPAFNAAAAIAIHEKQVLKHGKIEMADGKGAGGYFASRSMSKIKADVEAGNIGSFDATAAPTSSSMVHNTDRHGPVVTQNLNNVAKGLFTYPAAGAMLWVFFREGNPLFPVYFAASYSKNEWSSAYGLASNGPGYKPEATADNQTTSTGGMLNLNGVGGIRWEDTNSPTDRMQDQKSIMFFGEDGSNIFMGKGYTQYFSKFDRRDQVEGDKWSTVLGFEERWVQGDKNSVVMGDSYVKIGNVSQTAVDAVKRIQEIIVEIQKPLSET